MVLRVFRPILFLFFDKQSTIFVMGYREAVMVQGVFSLNKFFFDRQFHCFKPTKLSSRDGLKNVVQNVIFHLGSHRLDTGWQAPSQIKFFKLHEQYNL